jgi:hypothetical protein
MTHGKNLQSGYFWQFYGRFLVVFWYSDTVYLWYIYGIFMVYLWYIYGICLVDFWYAHISSTYLLYLILSPGGNA